MGNTVTIAFTINTLPKMVDSQLPSLSLLFYFNTRNLTSKKIPLCQENLCLFLTDNYRIFWWPRKTVDL